MKMKKITALLAVALVSGSAFATDGYFAHGYGMKAKGMGGVGIALPQDSLAAATNPAGMVMVGDRLDVGVDWFKPNRSSEIVGNGAGLNGTYSGNGDSSFLVPEFGYNKMMGWDMSVGVSVYGNGGMNTRYNSSPFRAFGGSNPAGVNLEQLFIAPTFAMKVNKDHAFGVSIVMAYQTFGAYGLGPFAGSSSNAGSLTDRGNDHSTGFGLRLGWTGKVSESVTLGATYASRIKGKFNSYQGLFAEQGRFDIPENFGIGIAVKATPQLTLAGDIEQINYGKVQSIANPVNCLFTGCQLGQSGGAGFGWGNMTAYKLGVTYEQSKDLTLRAGVNIAKQPIPASQTFFNVLAPGVIERHLTLGGTWTLANMNEVTLAYMHAFNKGVNGSGSINALLGGGEANVKMYQDSLGLAYGIKF